MIVNIADNFSFFISYLTYSFVISHTLSSIKYKS